MGLFYIKLEETIQEVSHRYSEVLSVLTFKDEVKLTAENVEEIVNTDFEEESTNQEELISDKLYSVHEEQLLAEQFYKPSSGYSFSSEEKKTVSVYKLDEEFEQETSESEMLSLEEAHETHLKMQYAAVLGSQSDISPSDRRKFDLWIKFNPSYFSIFKAGAFTQEVNYGSL